MSLISDAQNKIQSLLGTPYQYGVTDCSWFTQKIYQDVLGINIGRDTSSQLANGQVVGADGPQNWAYDLSQAQFGDLIFYGYPGASGPNAHVVFYQGNGQMAQAGGANVNQGPVFDSAAPDEPFLGIRRYANWGSASQAMSNANIPSWESQILDAMGQSGQLSGVSPQIIGAIDQAESSGQGGSINSQGYGGWFGLGVGHSYPAGTATQSLLQSTSQQSFQEQATLASSLFSQLLTQFNNDPYRAEAAYQTGPASGVTGGTEGDNVFSNLGVPSSVAPSAVLTSANTSSSQASYQAAGSAVGKVFQYIDGFLNPSVTLVPGWINIFTGANSVGSQIASIVDRSIGILIGVGLMYIGITTITRSGSSNGGSLDTLADLYTASQARSLQRELAEQRGARHQAADTRSSERNAIAAQRAEIQRAREERLREKEQQTA